MVTIISTNTINAAYGEMRVTALNWQADSRGTGNGVIFHTHIVNRPLGVGQEIPYLTYMRIIDVPLDKIYVPTAKRKTLEVEKVEPLAEDILENGLKTPIYVRLGKDRYVLVHGLHRVEAVKLLGEDTIEAQVVQAQKH